MNEALFHDVKTVAGILGVSDDLVYLFIKRGDLPAIEMGRRKLVPAQAISMLVERALDGFDPAALLARLSAPAMPSSVAGEALPAASDAAAGEGFGGAGPLDTAGRLGEVPASNVGETGPARGLVRPAPPSTRKNGRPLSRADRS